MSAIPSGGDVGGSRDHRACRCECCDKCGTALQRALFRLNIDAVNAIGDVRFEDPQTHGGLLETIADLVASNRASAVVNEARNLMNSRLAKDRKKAFLLVLNALVESAVQDYINCLLGCQLKRGPRKEPCQHLALPPRNGGYRSSGGNF